MLHIGIDDTDSVKGGCTTWLATEIIAELPEFDLIGPPRLVRLNPNVPWKTRGNGAVRLTIKTNNPQKIKNKITDFVANYSDIKNVSTSKYGGKLIFSSGEVSFSSFDLMNKEIQESRLRSLLLPKKYLIRHKINKNKL